MKCIYFFAFSPSFRVNSIKFSFSKFFKKKKIFLFFLNLYAYLSLLKYLKRNNSANFPVIFLFPPLISAPSPRSPPLPASTPPSPPHLSFRNGKIFACKIILEKFDSSLNRLFHFKLKLLNIWKFHFSVFFFNFQIEIITHCTLLFFFSNETNN